MTQEMMQDKVLNLMSELGALHEGHFLLSSGLHSDKYFQCARILQFPELARELGAAMAGFFPGAGYDLVVSPALGGILIGHEVARALGRRFVFTERKDGRMMIRRGFEIAEGEKVVIAEDVVTRGTSLLEVAAVVEAAGGKVVGLTSIIDRTSGEVELPLPLQSLARVSVRTWDPEACPLCREGKDLVKPGSRGN
ncbi:MAG: orotate phosphoribosyltransferase [Candidatus Krumholzibacteriia bacterium]